MKLRSLAKQKQHEQLQTAP